MKVTGELSANSDETFSTLTELFSDLTDELKTLQADDEETFEETNKVEGEFGDVIKETTKEARKIFKSGSKPLDRILKIGTKMPDNLHREWHELWIASSRSSANRTK